MGAIRTRAAMFARNGVILQENVQTELLHDCLQMGTKLMITNSSSNMEYSHYHVQVLKHGLLQIKYVPTAENSADIFNKPLPAPSFRLLQDELVS